MHCLSLLVSRIPALGNFGAFAALGVALGVALSTCLSVWAVPIYRPHLGFPPAGPPP